MNVVSLGPWLFPVGLVALALGWFAARIAAGFLRKRAHGDVVPLLPWALIASLIAARVAYVARWWPAYAVSPWGIIDVRDGGFEPLVGATTLVVLTLLLMWRQPKLRRALPAVATAGLVVWAFTVFATTQLRTTAHPPLSTATLHQMDGSPTTLAALAGQPMVINLWATWCGPCRREMPMLLKASHTTPGVRFVFVDQGEAAATVRQFLATQSSAPEHILLDAGRLLARDYHAPGYPTTLFVRADGHLRDMQVGALSRAALAEHLLRITPAESTPQS